MTDETQRPQSYLRDEPRDSMQRQVSAPHNWHPALPTMEPDEAAQRMEDGGMWIRSVHFEFYYSYAVVEDCETGERYVVKDIIGTESWKKVCAPLHEWS